MDQETNNNDGDSVCATTFSQSFFILNSINIIINNFLSYKKYIHWYPPTYFDLESIASEKPTLHLPRYLPSS